MVVHVTISTITNKYMHTFTLKKLLTGFILALWSNLSSEFKNDLVYWGKLKWRPILRKYAS
jgi:hypothetical protein